MYPSFARAASESSCTSSPSIVIVPSEGGRKPAIIRSVVLFPAPFGPKNPTM
jgi:hypothetical protein